ncbi:hypothetical protein BPAE_0056g00240 [Botrytis paeoniae]|uniref:Uncharacterized protein n=1 Tax=Botrytis paeoniae TaxID=278948 RepID=A0A4Z1FWR9_9HELO|nr:hypothetical protein BPAE_0056g00240 [Botrytis paeoniae]
MALNWCDIEQIGQEKLFNYRGYMKGFVVASNIAKYDPPQRLKMELPEIKSTWKIVLSKIRDLDSCSKKSLKGFDSEFGYATRESLLYCDVGKSVTEETSVRSGRVHETGFYISSTGEFGIASAEVRENDFICHWKDTDITIIIRQRRDHYPLVSRAVLTSYEDTIPRFGEHAENIKGDALDLCLDPLTLQALTRPIKSKGGIPYWECLTMEDAFSKLVEYDATKMDNVQSSRVKSVVTPRDKYIKTRKAVIPQYEQSTRLSQISTTQAIIGDGDSMDGWHLSH